MMMSNNIFEESYSYSSLEHSPNLSGFYVGKEEMEMEMDSLDCGISLFDHQDLFDDEKSKKEALCCTGTSSFELLNKYRSRCRRLNKGEKIIPIPIPIPNMSMDTIIQLAAQNFIFTYELSHPYPTSILSHSHHDVRLVQNLLFCAHKVHKRHYQQARHLLLQLHCNTITSPHGTIVQRLVFYFTQALHQKIDRETGRFTPENNPIQLIKCANPNMMMAFHKELPLSQITKFAGIQAIVDHIGDATKLHFIDLEIRTGIHIIILMQALADHPLVEYSLKITAVGTTSYSKQSIEETGRRLQSFAASLALNMSFHVIMVDDVLDLKETRFDDDEAIAVYAEYTLTHMIWQPTRLEHLMRVLRGLKNVCVMVVAEVEVDLNSPVFVDRFVEALVFYGAYFEMMADSFKNDEKNRYIAESTCFSSSIRNLVATEGEQRKIRHVRMSVWRAFFERLGFRETELSMSSVYQANLLPKNFASGNSFTFDQDGKSLIIGWKGNPLSSLSAWN